MKRIKFSDICQGSRLAEERRYDSHGGVVLIADSRGLQRWPDADGLTYKTIWAFGRDEDHLEIAQPIYFKGMFEDKGVWRPTTKDLRIAHAAEKADHWLQNRNESVGG